jgi:hypothetical protein
MHEPPSGAARRWPRAAQGLLLALVCFALWWLGATLRGGRSLFEHAVIDQHTLQALAWLDGRADLGRKPRYLEVAEFGGRYYVSFPPAPALVELPLAVLFGRETPNSLALFGIVLAGVLAQHRMLLKRGFDERSALLASLAFVFGTNLYVSCVKATVWAQGQALGWAFAILGLQRVLDNPRRGLRGPGPGYLLLALAVGCRPFYLFLAPLFLALDVRTSGRSPRAAVVSAAAWMAPFLAALAWYNWLRFGNPLEFGHNHLTWARDLPGGIFSLGYLRRNLYHVWLRLPDWSHSQPPLDFDPWGTAFWLNNGIFVFALWGLARVRFEPLVRGAALAGLLTIWPLLLLHETNGWRQFGYRFMIDLLPLGFAVVLFAYRRFSTPMLAASLVSFLVNLYGLAFWKDLPHEPRPGMAVLRSGHGSAIDRLRHGFLRPGLDPGPPLRGGRVQGRDLVQHAPRRLQDAAEAAIHLPQGQRDRHA